MKGFEEFYGEQHLEELPQSPVTAEDLVILSYDTAKDECVMPDYLKAVAILANRVAALDASISILKHRQPFAPFLGLFSDMEKAVEQLTRDCMSLFEFATANNVLEALDRDFPKSEGNEKDSEQQD